MVEMGFHKQLRTSAFLDIIVKDCKLLRPELNLCEDWDCLVLHQTINASSILYKVSFVDFFLITMRLVTPDILAIVLL